MACKPMLTIVSMGRRRSRLPCLAIPAKSADPSRLLARSQPSVSLLLQDVTEICSKTISEVVKDFIKPAGFSKDWPSVPQLLSRLAQQTSKAHGMWGLPLA